VFYFPFNALLGYIGTATSEGMTGADPGFLIRGWGVADLENVFWGIKKGTKMKSNLIFPSAPPIVKNISAYGCNEG